MDRSGAMAQAFRMDNAIEEIYPASAQTAPGRSADKSELEGIWYAMDAKISGQYAPEIVGQRLSFRRDRFQICKEGALLFGGNFSTDPTAKPSAIDFQQSETDWLPGLWRGIYKRVGNELTICDNAPEMAKPRPKNFGESATPGYILVRFFRQS